MASMYVKMKITEALLSIVPIQFESIRVTISFWSWSLHHLVSSLVLRTSPSIHMSISAAFSIHLSPFCAFCISSGISHNLSTLHSVYTCHKPLRKLGPENAFLLQHFKLLRVTNTHEMCSVWCLYSHSPWENNVGNRCTHIHTILCMHVICEV